MALFTGVREETVWKFGMGPETGDSESGQDGSRESRSADFCCRRSALETQKTIGRAWPIFAGERGEYLLAADRPGPGSHLQAMAKTGNDGYMLPEQVWDENPPSGQPDFPRGEGTLSATPLSWSHAQFIRLAWSIDAGHPVEQPSIVRDRYVGATSQAGG